MGKTTHERLPHCEVVDFGHGHETWRIDHRLVDEQGRKIGGIATIRPILDGKEHVVRLQVTRDGNVQGQAREQSYRSLARAREAAENKLRAQGTSLARKYPRLETVEARTDRGPDEPVGIVVITTGGK